MGELLELKVMLVYEMRKRQGLYAHSHKHNHSFKKKEILVGQQI